MMCMTWASFMDGRRLSMMARSTSSCFATALARTTPPISGETTNQIVVFLAFDFIGEHRRAVDIVHRNTEKALDLFGMQVHRKHPVHPHGADHVGNYLGADGDPGRPYPAVLAGIAEIGDHGSDPVGRGAMQGVGDQQQFQNMVIGG